MTRSTPVSHTISAALTRVLNFVPRGYGRAFSGVVAPEKVPQMAAKFDRLYGIADSPSQRHTRKRAGRASAVLVLYAQPGAPLVHWLVLCTEGEGFEGEQLTPIDKKPWLALAGYELVRHNDAGRLSWTWRRPKAQMAEHHNMLRHLCGSQRWVAVTSYLTALARQPGFHGVRGQSFTLCQEARKKGYTGELPPLYPMHKIPHGEPLLLPTATKDFGGKQRNPR